VKINISYNKGKVLQALRYHFFSRREIKLMMILVNVFALLAGVLYGLKLIQPLPFLMSSVLWLWAWREFSSYYETPGFFHLYFDNKSFFLIPKDALSGQEELEEAREIFRTHISRA
jgi:YcxB-like protein